MSAVIQARKYVRMWVRRGRSEWRGWWQKWSRVGEVDESTKSCLAQGVHLMLCVCVFSIYTTQCCTGVSLLLHNHLIYNFINLSRLISTFEWQGAILVTAALILLCILFGILFRPLQPIINNNKLKVEFRGGGSLLKEKFRIIHNFYVLFFIKTNNQSLHYLITISIIFFLIWRKRNSKAIRCPYNIQIYVNIFLSVNFTLIHIHM